MTTVMSDTVLYGSKISKPAAMLARLAGGLTGTTMDVHRIDGGFSASSPPASPESQIETASEDLPAEIWQSGHWKGVEALGVHPSPMWDEAEISFELMQPGFVELRVTDWQGRCVAELLSGSLPSGPHRQVWDGCDDARAPVAEGRYLVRVSIRDADGCEYLVTSKLKVLR